MTKKQKEDINKIDTIKGIVTYWYYSVKVNQRGLSAKRFFHNALRRVDPSFFSRG